jgi:hypothetical protein
MVSKPAVLESDCLYIVKALQNSTVDRARFSGIIEEIKASMLLLPEVKVSKIGRECNRVAHELASLARRTLQCAVWRSQAPSCISELLKIDCISLSL